MSRAPRIHDSQDSEQGVTESSSDSGIETPGADSIPDTEFGEIDVDLIDANPRQPRTFFDEDQLSELVQTAFARLVCSSLWSIRQDPEIRSGSELIMGERRLPATKDAGLSAIPAIIRYVDDTDLLRDALLENLHRAELNPLEEAAASGQLLEDFGCTRRSSPGESVVHALRFPTHCGCSACHLSFSDGLRPELFRRDMLVQFSDFGSQSIWKFLLSASSQKDSPSELQKRQLSC